MARLSTSPGAPTRDVWKQLENTHSGLVALEEVLTRLPLTPATPGGRTESAVVAAHLAVLRRLQDIRGPLADLDRSNASLVPGEKIYMHPSKVPELLSLRPSQLPALPQADGGKDVFDESGPMLRQLPATEKFQQTASKRQYEICLKSAEIFRSEATKMFGGGSVKRAREQQGVKANSPAQEVLKRLRDHGVL